LADVNTLNEDLKNLRKQVRVRPHFYKGKMDGFRVTGIRKNSVFYEKLGLRNGDIVAGVNGEAMKSINDVTSFYNGFKQLEGTVATDVDIKRNGLTGKIRYSIE
jgi:general secretion pathway protein C